MKPAPQEYWCMVCGQRAHYGFGRPYKPPSFWTCAPHRDDGDARAARLVPSATVAGPVSAAKAQGALL